MVAVGQTSGFIDQLSVFQIRAIITALTLLLLVIVVHGLIPSIAEIVENRLLSRLSEVEMVPAHVHDNISTLVSSLVIERLFQTAFTVGSAVFLMGVWGELAVVSTVMEAIGGIVPYVMRGLFTILLVLGTYISASTVNDWLQEASNEYKSVDKHQMEIVARTFQVLLLIVAGIILLAIWQIDIGNILLGAGVLGVVIGFAVRETLSAIIAGFLLMFSRPFEIGDWIAAGEHAGTVTKITILNTRLRNIDGERIIIPNDQIASETIVNRSRMNRLRLTVEVGVSYDSDIEQAKEIALEAIEEAEATSSAPSPQVIPQSFGDSAVVLEGQFWIENPNARKEEQATAEVVRHIKERFDEEGITIPFPQRTLHGGLNGNDD